MPVMDGFEMAQEVRKHEEESGLSRTPIIAITANALERVHADAIQDSQFV